MAGDWIKMRSNLWDDPRVARLCDMTDQPESMVIGALYWIWAAADQHSEDGIMHGLSLRSIDRKTGISGIGAALVDIGWLADHPEGVRIVRFDEHNGASAKKRCQTAKRVANFKAGNSDETLIQESGNAYSVTETLPVRDLEEEEEKDNYSSLSGAQEAELASLPTRKGLVCGMLRKAGMSDAAPHYLTDDTWGQILGKRTDEEIIEVARAKMAAMPGQRIGLKYIAKALMDDPQPITANARASPSQSRRQTVSDDRKAASMILTGRKPENERPIANNERDITADCQRIA